MKNVGIINKLRDYVDLHTLKQLYYSFIYPYLTSGITSSGSACKTRIHKIKTKQNRCVRSIFDSLLIAGTVLCPISIFWKFSVSKTFTNLN